MAMAARMPMMATTIMSSMSVKPLAFLVIAASGRGTPARAGLGAISAPVRNSPGCAPRCLGVKHAWCQGVAPREARGTPGPRTSAPMTLAVSAPFRGCPKTSAHGAPRAFDREPGAPDHAFPVAILRTEGLTKVFEVGVRARRVTAVDDLTLSVEQGEI